ncbi:MAG: tRNA1(Val) (adenine(37)-N6)-methyltransferase [Clostridia bacterium]|nr:tRNA1(Val) (adenine(37)-N6)-methyltransferase [Clostridia bacterium]
MKKIDENILKEKESIFDLERKGYKIIQSKDTFMFGIDSVLLAHFAKHKKTDKVIDLGCGTGVIPILMEARYEGKDYTGIDIIPESVDMAQRSVALNNLENKISIEHCDLKTYYKKATKKFDVVTTNPPYMIVSSNSKNEKIVSKNKNQNLEIARHEIYATINDVCKAANRLLKTKGKFFIVYKPDRLVSLISAMRENKIEPKRIRFVQSYKDSEASIVLVEGVKDANESCIIEKPLVIYEKENKYTKEVLDIYNK